MVREDRTTRNSTSFKILEETDDTDEALNIAEIKWFEKLEPRFYGKKPSLDESWTHSDETRKKISKSLRLFHGNKGKALKDRERFCLTCNEAYFSQKPNAKYCSRECIDINAITRNHGLLPISAFDGKLISKLYKSGNSLREVAKEIGVSHTTIKKVLIREGTPIRLPNGGRKRKQPKF